MNNVKLKNKKKFKFVCNIVEIKKEKNALFKKWSCAILINERYYIL